MQLDWTKRLGYLFCWQRVFLAAVLVFGCGVPLMAETTVAPSSLDEAVALVEQAHAGRVLSARAEERNGGVVYLIRLLTEDQQVRTFEIPKWEGVRP